MTIAKGRIVIVLEKSVHVRDPTVIFVINKIVRNMSVNQILLKVVTIIIVL